MSASHLEDVDVTVRRPSASSLSVCVGFSTADHVNTSRSSP